MKYFVLSCLIGLILLAVGCKEKVTETLPGDESEFVLGEILVSTTLEITNVYFRSFVDSLSLRVLQSDSARITFWIQVPSDSVLFYVSSLSSDQHFLRVGQLGSVIPSDTNRRYIFVDYNYGKSKPDTVIGKRYVESLGFTPNRTVVLYSLITISVPIGKEDYWVDRFRSYPFVLYAQLNHISRIS
jgi:hypothetical protein